MRTANSFPAPRVEVPAVKPEALSLALATPPAAAGPSGRKRPGRKAFEALRRRAETQLKFVQVGVWEARRRSLAGRAEDLDVILTHLDEDVELLRQALEAALDRPPRKRREKASLR